MNEEQREQLAELTKELQERIRELNEEMLDKSLKVLKPEQRKKLEGTSWQNIGQGYGYGGEVASPMGKRSN